jgi:hypothetical protein
MSAHARYDGIEAGPAKTEFIVMKPIHTAFTGTDTAALKEPVSRVDTFA